MTIFGRAVVPEVQKMQAVSSALLRSGSCAASPRGSATNNSSCGSFAPSGDQAPKRTRSAGASPTIAATSMSL